MWVALRGRVNTAGRIGAIALGLFAAGIGAGVGSGQVRAEPPAKRPSWLTVGPSPAPDRCRVSLGIALGGDAWVGAPALGTGLSALTWATGDAALVDADAIGYATQVGLNETELVVALEGPRAHWARALGLQLARLGAELAFDRWRGDDAGEVLAPALGPTAARPLAVARRDVRFVRAGLRAFFAAPEEDAEAQAARLQRALESAPVALAVACDGVTRGDVNDLMKAAHVDLAARARSPATPLPARDRSPGERALPPTRAGFGRLWLVWELPPGRATPGQPSPPDPWAPLAARLLAHPGDRLTERAIGAYGIARAIDAAVLPEMGAFVLAIDAAGRDPRAARDRVLEDLAAFAASTPEVTGAARLIGMPADQVPTAVELGRWVRTTLAASRAISVVEPTSVADRTPFPVIDSEVVGQWFRATLDMRCPAPAETRDRAQLLAEKHALDSEKYLALTRAIGSDPERLAQLEREISDRCVELQKLRGLVPARRFVALYRAIRCAVPEPTEAGQARAEGRIFRQFDVDPSAFKPLVLMAQDDPALAAALAEIDRRCPVRIVPK